jgi:hypothetical protein
MQRPSFRVDVDTATGQLLSVGTDSSEARIVTYQAGPEILINRRPVSTTHVRSTHNGADHVTVMHVREQTAYGAGHCLEITRFVTAGGIGLHHGPPDSAHVRYHVRRVPWGDYENGLDMIWCPPIEAPFSIDSFTGLAAPTQWFGPATRMRAIAIGGSGPREHVSYEDGPVSEVVPWLKTGFRSSFPGQMTIPGALYYHPDDERFVWVIARRPHVGGKICFAPDAQAFEFSYFKKLSVHGELMTPDVSYYWGQGLAQAERIFAQQFDQYEEPPDWWYRTAWFWLHPMWQRGASYKTCEEAVRILAGECGVTGFGIGQHDIPFSGRDIDVGSLRPSPSLGGESGLRSLSDVIRGVGGRSYVWSSRTGLFQGRDHREQWCIRGEDGRKVTIRPPAQGVHIDMLDNADTAYRQYLFSIIELYVRDLGVDGFFWDSGTQPMPPDFTPRPEVDCPGETMVAMLKFYEEAYRLGRSLSKDFFMWFEGINTDIRTNAFAVDNKKHGEHSGHALMQRIAHVGPRRLVWRSSYSHDVASGFPFILPVNDIGIDCGASAYRKIAADPLNRWVCKILRERGCRQAIGVGDGVSLLDEYVVVCPGATGRLSLPRASVPGGKLRHVLSGQTVRALEESGEHAVYDLTEAGPWEVQNVPAGVAKTLTAGAHR